jgi:glycogen debranching enzyme
LYRGDRRDRDAAYHQGIVWEWLIGAYVDALLAIYKDRYSARDVVAAMANQLTIAGLGTLSEIHEAQAPYRPAGCIAQAWSVAEVLRALKKTR